jgi:hypothetical protein
MGCPYGGKCIDPGYPSDCMANGGCVCFNSTEEKTAFDNAPKNYHVRTKSGEVLDFTTATQAKFYIADFGGQRVNNSKS